MFRNKITAFLLVLFSMLSLATSVLAMSEENTKKFMQMSEQERKFLLMYFDEDELFIVSTTRSLKSIDRVAENVEVVTAADIELMNAHTLADVLYTINGVQIQSGGSSPGNQSTALIQGSDPRHVAIFLDGVPLNNLSTFTAIVGTIPVQQISKVEIIKGPASSVWGSSLGGVINIITKSATNSEKTNGMLSASYGEKNTGDFRGEINGRKENFGFYVSAGRLQSDGFRPFNDVSEDNIYSKLSYDFSSNISVLFSILYTNNKEDDGGDPTSFAKKGEKRIISNLGLNTALNKETALNVSLWSSMLDYYTFYSSDNSKPSVKEDRYGAAARLTWNHGPHNLVIGSDYDDGTMKSDIIVNDKQSLRKWAFYANDTISLGKFSITPGIRYDSTNSNGSFTSPSLGMTYEFLKKTILRFTVSEGFNIPPLSYTFLKPIFGDGWEWQNNPDLKVEKVTSYQAGVETGALEYLWLKLSAFRHDIRDGIVPETIGDVSKYVNEDKIRRQGFEMEMKTAPVYNTFLSAGATYIQTKNRLTGDEVKGVPTYTYVIGLHYDDKRSFSAVLQGNYTWWNQTGDYLARYSSLIVDMNLTKTLYQQRANKLEAFLTGHNIFNGSQYWYNYYMNAGRWIEAGVRYRF